MGSSEIAIDLTQVQFPDNAAEEYLAARDQSRASYEVQGVPKETVLKMIPMKEWDSIEICTSLLQNAVEALYRKKYFSPERKIVVASQSIRDQKAFLFRKMNKQGKFNITPQELALLAEALKQDLQAMDGYSYVSEYINGLAEKHLETKA